MLQEPPEFRDELAELHAESLKITTLCIGGIGYLWLIWVLWPNTGGDSPSLVMWMGSGLLVLGAVLGYALRHRFPGLASGLLVGVMFLAVSSGMLVFRTQEIAYLFTLPVIFSGVLLGPRSVLPVTVSAVFLTLSIGSIPVGDRLFSSSMVLPSAVIALVALASWLSARNLHTALVWVWHAYERARQNERDTRERQGELRRALKALDEATYRLRRMNYMLALARDQAEEARRLKQQFAQTISHELRTPLNLIVGFTELMTESPEYYGASLPPAYLRDLNIVYRNACHLQKLVNDVLDLARIEAAQMSLVPEEVDPADLVREAVHTARSLVESRGLALYTEIEPDLPRLWVDPTRIRQVLFNLLNNAARFTDEGSITVSVHQEGEEVVFAVKDTGVGIAPEDLPRIFEEFEQADKGTRRRHGGAGLGLAISKRFVELHGGRIWAESQVGQGSTFYFSLPIYRTEAAMSHLDRLAGSAEGVSFKEGEEPVLLAVTPSPAAAALLTRYVRGCRVVVVSDLGQAQYTARQLMPQVIVIDRACGGIDAEELEALAQEWEMAHIPFVACPLPGEEVLRQQLMVDGYLVKPVSRRSLWDMLRQFGENVDKVLVIDDDQDFVLFISRLLEDSPIRRYQIIEAYSGREGLEMMRRHQPDMVLLDLRLPDIQGAQVVERIRSNPAWQYIPIIVVSAQDELDRQGILQQAVTITRASGILPGELVHWIQAVVGTATMSLLAAPTLRGAPIP
ncbi:MAG TPA: response regulator [Caldilineae bacterium]|nr:response regulator [Caldilineae bacterium]